jgi:hypothetical protein
MASLQEDMLLAQMQKDATKTARTRQKGTPAPYPTRIATAPRQAAAGQIATSGPQRKAHASPTARAAQYAIHFISVFVICGHILLFRKICYHKTADES